MVLTSFRELVGVLTRPDAELAHSTQKSSFEVSGDSDSGIQEDMTLDQLFKQDPSSRSAHKMTEKRDEKRNDDDEYYVGLEDDKDGLTSPEDDITPINEEEDDKEDTVVFGRRGEGLERRTKLVHDHPSALEGRAYAQEEERSEATVLIIEAAPLNSFDLTKTVEQEVSVFIPDVPVFIFDPGVIAPIPTNSSPTMSQCSKSSARESGLGKDTSSLSRPRMGFSGVGLASTLKVLILERTPIEGIGVSSDVVMHKDASYDPENLVTEGSSQAAGK